MTPGDNYKHQFNFFSVHKVSNTGVFTMSYDHAENGAGAGGPRGRHLSVSHYEANLGAPTYDGARRKSSIVPAGSISAGMQAGNVLNQKDETFRKMSVAVPNLAELSADARAGAESERKMGFRQGVKLYPLAIFFSFGLSLAVVMEGYDTWLLGNFYGMRAFTRKFGEPAGIVDGEQKYEVNVTWQNALGNGTATAQIIGLFINGIVSERIGYRYTMIGSLFLITAFIFIQFFATNVQMLLAGYIMSGLPW